MKKLSFLVLVIFLCGTQLSAQGSNGSRDSGPGISREIVRSQVSSDLEAFSLVRLAGSLDRPWSLAFLPDGSFLVAERPGRLVVLSERGRFPVSGGPEVYAVGQGGLLDVALARDFSASGRIFLTYSGGGQGRYGTFVGTAVLRYQGAQPRLDGFRDIWQTPVANRSAGGQHFGSRIYVNPDGTLLVTLGERGQMARAQNPADPAGSVIRIHPDGSIPNDNPFVGRSVVNARGERVEPLPEIYSYGHRNPQGIAADADGRVWAHEHGPRGGDEINLLQAGANYGWPVTSHGIDYSGATITELRSMPGVTDPLLVWIPSIAPSGFTFYEGDVFPAWRNSAFAGALAGQHLRRISFSGGKPGEEEVLFRNELGRIRDVRTGPDGFLYILTDGPNASLYRLEPAQ